MNEIGGKPITWEDIQELVRDGKIGKYYLVGDQLIVNYNGSPIVWDIVAIDDATPADTTKTHSVTLVPHNPLPDYMVFDNKEPNNGDCYRIDCGNKGYKDSLSMLQARGGLLNTRLDTKSW